LRSININPMTLLFLNFSGGEIVVLLLVILIVFGPKQAFEMARKAGKTLNDLKRITEKVKNEIMKEEDKITQQTTISSSKKELSNKIETIDADCEIAEKMKQQELERDKNETERTTTI